MDGDSVTDDLVLMYERVEMGRPSLWWSRCARGLVDALRPGRVWWRVLRGVRITCVAALTATLHQDAHADSSAEAPDYLPKRTPFTIANIHPEDAFAAYPEILGMQCESLRMVRSDAEWYGGTARCGGDDVRFYKIAFTYEAADVTPTDALKSVYPFNTVGIEVGAREVLAQPKLTWGVSYAIGITNDNQGLLNGAIRVTDAEVLFAAGIRFQTPHYFWGELGLGARAVVVGPEDVVYGGAGPVVQLGAHFPLGNASIAKIGSDDARLALTPSVHVMVSPRAPQFTHAATLGLTLWR